MAPMNNIHIRIDEKTFATQTNSIPERIISKLEFNLNSGEFVCLVGPSGCGKTTLLNLIAGLDTDFQGNISHQNQQTSARIGYVFQQPRLLPWRTVRENIELATNAPAEIIAALLASMNLTDVQHAYPQHLSLGMSRRVSIIRAFAIDPYLLLMDEPFVSLDPPTARQVRQLLIKLWTERPHTILFVTHDLREAITLADKLVFLSTKPMSVISEIPVPMSRSERENEANIETFRQQLINDHPDIRNLL
jgi:NitT/TauT family transport system ATP-binding protein